MWLSKRTGQNLTFVKHELNLRKKHFLSNKLLQSTELSYW